MNKPVGRLEKLALILSLIGLTGASATSSLLSQSSTSSFSDEAVMLSPHPLPKGLNVGDLFADWGIALANDAGSAPVSDLVTVFPLNAGPIQNVTVIANGLPGDEGAGILTIWFGRPLTRAALALGSLGTTTSTVSAFDLDGALLDESVRTTIGGNTVQLPAVNVVEAGEGREIYRIEVAYEDPAIRQMLLSMLLDFVEPLFFHRCIAQVAHGQLPDARSLQTQLSLTSPIRRNRGGDWIGSKPAATLSLDFFDSSGAPLPVALNGEISSQVTGTLAPRESKVFATSETVSASGLDAGYACLTSNYPIELAAVFRVLDEDGGLVAEAGIDGQRPGHRFVGLLEKDPIEETNTALALANVSEMEATAAVSFFLAPNTTFSAEVVLGPGEHGSWFADELSSQLADRDAVGTVEILSDQPIVGTILRTIQGVVSASLPLNRQRAADEE